MLNQCFIEDRLIIFLFYSNQRVISKNYFYTCHPNISFSFEKERNGQMYSLDVNVSSENGEFVATFYQKSTLSGYYTHFESFLCSTHKVRMLHSLYRGYRCI